jgi:hypothetical protein
MGRRGEEVDIALKRGLEALGNVVRRKRWAQDLLLDRSGRPEQRIRVVVTYFPNPTHDTAARHGRGAYLPHPEHESPSFSESVINLGHMQTLRQ